MAYDARAVANFLLDYADQRSRPVTHLTLQKIIYFCHAWHLALHDEPLVGDPVEAWGHGPVFRSVYKSFKSARRGYVDFRAKGMNFQRGKEEIIRYDFDNELQFFLTNIFDVYAKYTASDLRRISHRKGGPWDEIWSRGSQGAFVGMRIPNALIGKYFREDSQGLPFH